MTPAEIELAIAALITLGQFIATQIKANGELTEDEKAGYLARLDNIKGLVDASKFPET